jgi:predicted RNase H-like HicB family nuclease
MEKKEIRFNYTIDDGIYVGYVVNHEGVICQADSLEELEKKLKMLLKSWLEYWTQLNADPETKFSLVEE